MATKKKTEEVKEVAVVTPPKKELVLEGDPQAQLDFAMKAANALMKAVGQKPKPVMIRGEQYLEYGDWQTLARFFGATASVAWSKKLVDDKGAFIGYEARAEVLHNGLVISAAEAMCMKAEKNWNNRDEFMLRSMAQTRASAKALRNAYGWVAELAGMKSTPAEEMDGVAGYDAAHTSSYTVVRKDMEDEPVEPMPPRKNPITQKYEDNIEKKQLQLKYGIKKTIDSIVFNPLESGNDYVEWVEANTGLNLLDQSIPNLEKILDEVYKLTIKN